MTTKISIASQATVSFHLPAMACLHAIATMYKAIQTAGKHIQHIGGNIAWGGLGGAGGLRIILAALGAIKLRNQYKAIQTASIAKASRVPLLPYCVCAWGGIDFALVV